jgi:hypothetical protein
VGFNALGVISYDPAKKSFNLRSYALGHSGDFTMQPTPDGYVWEIPQGPDLIRYTRPSRTTRCAKSATRIAGSRPPVRIFEMTLKPRRRHDWPAANPVPPR